MATSIQHASPGTVVDVLSWADQVAVKLRAAGVDAKLWAKHARIRVYVRQGPFEGHIRFHPHCADRHGDVQIKRLVLEVLGNELYRAPSPL